MIEYFRYNKQKDINYWAKVAKGYYLYVNGWMMHGYYNQPNVIKCMALAYSKGDGYIGCSLLLKNNNTAVYVKPEYRNNGIGTNLIKLATKHYRGVFGVDYNAERFRSEKRKFFEKSMKHKSVRDVYGSGVIW